MKVSRNDIGLAIAKWEKRAKSEMYLDDFLHPKARAWLIEAIESLHAQSAGESSEVEQSRVESVSVKSRVQDDHGVIHETVAKRKKGH